MKRIRFLLSAALLALVTTSCVPLHLHHAKRHHARHVYDRVHHHGPTVVVRQPARYVSGHVHRHGCGH